MAFEHLEPVVRTAIASLQAGLNDAIDAVNAQHDDFAVEHVRDDAYKPGGLGTPAVVWPVVEVSASDAQGSNSTVQQAAWNRVEANVIIALWCRCVDDATLYWTELRYGQALLQVLCAPDAFGAELYVERWAARYRRRDPEQGPAAQLEGFVIIALMVIGDETL